ncbi:hypothetical protein DB41_CS00090 [Neochlamydia sp. TUME1]|nr:hypothetical protein DB41_CS00090 [Neochlamydia sp. TUME1]
MASRMACIKNSINMFSLECLHGFLPFSHKTEEIRLVSFYFFITPTLHRIFKHPAPPSVKLALILLRFGIR